MGIIAWIIVGAIAGFLANRIVGGNDGIIMTVILGIVGGLVGGYVAATVLKIGSVDAVNIESIVIATLGAVAILLAVRAVGGTSRLSKR